MSQRISGSLLGVLTTAAMIGGPLGCGGSNGLPPSSQFAQICTSVDPQRRWVRSYMNEAYLWYSEIPVIDASGYPTPTAYFNALLVRKPTASRGRSFPILESFGSPTPSPVLPQPWPR